jgi:hypothetical protein
MPQATPFARAQQNAASGPQLSPRDAAALFLALIVQNKFGDQNGIAGFAQLLHQGSGAAAALWMDIFSFVADLTDLVLVFSTA